jgi:hypothetical protein
MDYIHRFEERFCVDYAEENEWTKEPEFHAKLNISQLNIDHFMDCPKKGGALNRIIGTLG